MCRVVVKRIKDLTLREMYKIAKVYCPSSDEAPKCGAFTYDEKNQHLGCPLYFNNNVGCALRYKSSLENGRSDSNWNKEEFEYRTSNRGVKITGVFRKKYKTVYFEED